MTAPVVETGWCVGCAKVPVEKSWQRCPPCRREHERSKRPPKPKTSPRYSVSRQRVFRTPEEQRQYQRETKMWSEYKVSPQQYAEMLAVQQGLCAICRRPPKPGKVLAIDHDHKTGAVRGLLCGKCNLGIGLLKDDASILWAAICYLANARRKQKKT